MLWLYADGAIRLEHLVVYRRLKFVVVDPSTPLPCAQDERFRISALTNSEQLRRQRGSLCYALSVNLIF